ARTAAGLDGWNNLQASVPPAHSPTRRRRRRRSPVPTTGKPGSARYDWTGQLTPAEASQGVSAAAVVAGGRVGAAEPGAVEAAGVRVSAIAEAGPADVEGTRAVTRVVARIIAGVIPTRIVPGAIPGRHHIRCARVAAGVPGRVDARRIDDRARRIGRATLNDRARGNVRGTRSGCGTVCRRPRRCRAAGVRAGGVSDHGARGIVAGRAVGVGAAAVPVAAVAHAPAHATAVTSHPPVTGPGVARPRDGPNAGKAEQYAHAHPKPPSEVVHGVVS